MASPNGSNGIAKGEEPIAIVGMGCRWPGNVRDASGFWELLRNKRSGYREFGDHRFPRSGFHHPNPDRPGSVSTEGGFLLGEDPRLFDHAFFGMGALEIETMDPSQRKLLEVVYEAFENSGESWESFSGKNVGVYVGNFSSDHLIIQGRDTDNPRPYASVGTGTSILSNRVNYIFNLRGPSVTMDTACSSSMYALHVAISALRNNDCGAAMVAASNTIMDPSTQLMMTKLGVLSPTSTSHTFDVAADGYARGEGFSALYVMKLSAAVQGGYPIRAVIRGTALNANGRTGGITHPGREGQEAVIKKAYENAGGLRLQDTTYFECHGTGTPVGDPIEVSAIGNVFESAMSPERPLMIGSVKTNIGHTEPASAIAGIMKVVLSFEEGLIPASIGVKTLNPNLDLKQGRLQVLTENTPWPKGRLRRASVNSFGYGGANGHCILDHVEDVLPDYRPRPAQAKPDGVPRANGNGLSAEKSNGHAHTNGQATSGTATGIQSNGHATPDQHSSPSWAIHYPLSHRVTVAGGHDIKPRPRVLLAFSAHNDTSLSLNIAAMSAMLTENCLADAAYTLGARRSRFLQRTFRIVDRDRPAEGLAITENTTASSQQVARLGFIFTGQGAQWHGMGAELLQYCVFESSIEYMDSVLAKLPLRPNWNIKSFLQGHSEKDAIHKPEISQTVCTAVQIALVDLLHTWNVKPDSVVGHSSGEIAATYAAGRITAAEAIAAAFLRGHAVAQNKAKGAMLALGVGLEKAEAIIEPFRPRVRVAAINSPNSVTLSGDSDAIATISTQLDEMKIFNRALQTGGNAYHSHHMLAIGEGYSSALAQSLEYVRHLGQADSRYRYPLRPWTSSVFPHKDSAEIILRPDYWRENLELPVRFSEAVFKMFGSPGSADVFVEIGPHPALKGPVGDILNAGTPKYFSTLKRNEDGQLSMLRLAGNLFCSNSDIDLSAVNSVDRRNAAQLEIIHGRTSTKLPPYQYSYGPIIYHESRFSREFRSRVFKRHDILGSRLPGNAKLRPQWRNILRPKDLPWLSHHRLLPHAVFPAAGYIAMAIEAASQMHHELMPESGELAGFILENVSFSTAMRLPEHELGLEIVTSLEFTKESNCATFAVSSVSADSDTWTEHCSGRVTAETTPHSADAISIKMDARTIDSRAWYKKFEDIGLGYGPSFQPLSQIQADPAQQLALARIALHTTENMIYGGESDYAIHPASLDALFQLALVASHGGQVDRVHTAFVPVHIDRLRLKSGFGLQTEPATAIALGELKGLRSAHARLQMLDKMNHVAVDVERLRCVSYVDSKPSVSAAADGTFSSPFFQLTWKPDIRTLSNDQARKLYPPPAENTAKAYLFDKLEKLGTFFVAEIYERFVRPGRFSAGPKHIHEFLSWVDRRMKDDNQWTKEAAELGSTQRSGVIDELLSEVGHMNDVKIAKEVFDNIQDILEERKTGLDVVLQNNLLHGMYDNGLIMTGAYPQLVRVFDLFGFCDPSMKILEIGAGTGGATRKILEALTGANGIKRYQDYTFTDVSAGFLSLAHDSLSHYRDIKYSVLDINEDPLLHGYEGTYDVVVACECLHATPCIVETLKNCCKLLKPGGRLVIVENTRAVIGHGLVLGHLAGYWDGIPDGRVESPFLHLDGWDMSLKESGFTGVDLVLDDYPAPYTTARTIVAKAVGDVSEVGSRSISKTLSSDIPPVYLLQGEGSANLRESVNQELTARGVSTQVVPLGDASSLPAGSRCIAFADGGDLLVQAHEGQFNAFKSLVRHSASLLWLTACGIVDGGSPDASVTTGLLRTIGTENPSSNFLALDVSPGSQISDPRLVRTIADLEASLKDRAAGQSREYEYVWKRDCLWVSRLVPDVRQQDEMEKRQALPSLTETLPWGSQGPVRAAFETPGLLSSLYFKPDEEVWSQLPDDWIQVKVAAVGLNWKDLLTSAGRFDMNTFSSEYSGVVSQIGSRVTNVAVGDRVYGYGRGRFGNYVRAPAVFSHRLLPEDDMIQAATIPLVGMTAVYAFEHVTRLQEGERVLIQSASGGLGLSAIQLAKSKGAVVFATAGTPEKRQYLVETEKIPSSHVFSSRDAADIPKMLAATGGKGFDVILSNANGPLLHESLRLLAPMGRFIDVGRMDVQNSKSLALELFQRNATFTSFDLAVADDLDPTLGPRLMQEVDKHFRANRMGPSSKITVFDVSQLDQALLAFSKGTHIGKLVVSFEDPGSLVRMVPAGSHAIFDPDASYIITGGLGGLGRSIVNFMAGRRAKHLVVMSRSRSLGPEAKMLIENLARSGVIVDCVSCDVSNREQVVRAVQDAAALRPIKGLVHAAVSYEDLSFDKLGFEQWVSGVAAKVIGTRNLHDALVSHRLDFFLMTTTIESVVALATQSVYTAANNFQDYFARWRRRQGLPASTASFGLINDVGHLSTNDTTLALMARNKVLDVTEHQFLHLLEPAFMNNELPVASGHGIAAEDSLSVANLVTCFDPATMAARKREEGAMANTPRWYSDARVSLIMRAFEDAERYQAAQDRGGDGEAAANDKDGGDAQFLRRDFQKAVQALRDGEVDDVPIKTKEELHAFVTTKTIAMVAQMLFIDLSGVDGSRSVAAYGVDSLVAAELRNWFSVAYGADISTLDLLDTGNSINALAAKIVDDSLDQYTN